MSDDGVVDLDSGSDSDSYHGRYQIETRRQSEYPRVAKKSTTTAPEVRTTSNYTTRRQAALAAKAQNEAQRLKDEAEEREMQRRKLARRTAARRVPGALYDEYGIHINTSSDVCDCLNKNCPGCYYPCKKCGSQKCGNECRCNRKFVYEEVEYHGYDFIVKCPFAK